MIAPRTTTDALRVRRAVTRGGFAELPWIRIEQPVQDVLDEPGGDRYREAGLLPGRHRRSLDAIHLAAALRLGADAMVSYDRRQVDMANLVGLPVLAP